MRTPQRLAILKSIIFYIIALQFITTGCQESLPEYVPPQNFTQAILSEYSGILYPDTARTMTLIHHCADTISSLIGVGLKNLFEETLDGIQRFNVYVEMESLDPRLPYYREFTLFDPSPGSQTITVDPNETYIVTFFWNRRDENGHLIDTGVDTTYLENPQVIESPPIEFRLRGSIQIWEQVPPRVTNDFILRIIFRRDSSPPVCTPGYMY